MKKILYLLFGLMLLNSCIKEIDIPIAYTDPKLVLNGFFTSDSLWTVQLSASKYIYATGEIPLISDATVEVSDNSGNSFALTSIGNGWYRSETQKPVQGMSYTISASHPNYESISSTATTITPIEMKSLEVGELVLIDSYEYRKIRMKFDDPQSENFYRINFFEVSKQPDWTDPELLDSMWVKYPTWVMYQDPNNSYESGYSSTSSLLLSDYYFNGDEYILDVFLDNYYFNEPYYLESGLHFLVEFHSISKDYYYYATSLENYNQSSDFELFATQPVQIYTNIENGLGVFAAYGTDVDSILMAY